MWVAAPGAFAAYAAKLPPRPPLRRWDFFFGSRVCRVGSRNPGTGVPQFTLTSQLAFPPPPLFRPGDGKTEAGINWVGKKRGRLFGQLFEFLATHPIFSILKFDINIDAGKFLALRAISPLPQQSSVFQNLMALKTQNLFSQSFPLFPFP